MLKRFLASVSALALGCAQVGAVPSGTPAPFASLLPIKSWTMQVLGDSRAAMGSIYAPGTSYGGSKSWEIPATWVEASLRGVRFDMTIAPQGFVGQAVGLKQLRDFRGTGCTYATATISGATGFAATATIRGGQIWSWTVTSPQTGGTAVSNAGGVAIASDCSGTVAATPVMGGIGTFAGSGQTLREIRERIPDICAGTYGKRPDIVQVIGGINDMTSSGVFSGWSGNTQANTGKVLAGWMMNIVNDLSACGIVAQVIADPGAQNAKMQAAYGLTGAQAATAIRTLAEYRQAMRRAAQGDATLNPNKTFFLFVDGFLPYWYDNSTINGDPIYYLTFDNLHPSQWGGALMGYFAAKQLQPYVQNAAFSSRESYGDAYDVTYNPGGNFGALWYGGTTTASSTTIGGTIPSVTYASNTNGTAPATGCAAASATIPTSAARDAEGMVSPSIPITIACAGVAGTGSANTVTAGIYNTITPPTGVVAGDYIEAACDVEYSGLKNVVGISVGIKDNTNGALFNMGGASNAYFPFGVSPTIDPLVSTAGQFGWFGYPLRFHSAPLQMQSNTAQLRQQIDLYLDVSTTPVSTTLIGATSGAAGNVRFRHCTVEKLNATLN